MGNNQLTILTPTYNRGYILGQLYNSLLRQTNKNFEWIVVDDGSTDYTKELVNKWKGSQEIRIKYIYQPNGGKHRALNRGIKSVESEYVIIVDSDDYLVDDAVETIYKWIDENRYDERLAGVSGNRGTDEKNRLGGFTKNMNKVIASNLERYKYNLTGDKAEVYKTKIMKEYPFPEFPGENFLREGIVWNRIAADGKKLVWYNKVIIICHYLADGLTKSDELELFRKNFNGYLANYSLLWEFQKGLIRYKSAVKFYDFLKKVKRREKIYDILPMGILDLCIIWGMSKLRFISHQIRKQIRRIKGDSNK